MSAQLSSSLRTALLALLFALPLGANVWAQQTSPAANSAAPAAVVAGAVTSSKPAWKELTPAQQTALQPLQAMWENLPAARKQKWLAIAESYAKLPPEKQSYLSSRMTMWATMTPAQRAQARLNYGDTKQLDIAPEKKQAQWEAYQALSPEDRQRLAATAPPKPTSTTPTRPVPAAALTATPSVKPETPRLSAKIQPKISASAATAPGFVLPQNNFMPK